jgi:hypothetical protein
MSLLAIFVMLSTVPLLYGFVRVFRAFQQLSKTAKETKVFALRKGSLSTSEWKQWNKEFIRWRLVRIVVWLALAEAVLLALALRVPLKLPILLPFVFLMQVIPTFTVYGLHLWLLYRYGRFNLQRFDPMQYVFFQLALLLMIFAAWMPIVSTWFMLKFLI